METLFFTIVAAVAVLASILVITCRNPINSALSLIMTFFCLATFYVMLDAPFLAAVQVIVYAGAIMVLIVFVIMLLNLRAESAGRYTHAIVGGGIQVLALRWKIFPIYLTGFTGWTRQGTVPTEGVVSDFPWRNHSPVPTEGKSRWRALPVRGVSSRSIFPSQR